MKRAFRYLHLCLGLASGLVVFIVALTGCIYCFEKEIKSLVYKDILFVEQGTSAKPIDELLSVVKKEYPKQKIKNVFISDEQNASIQFTLKNKLAVFVNPYTAEITGTIHQDNSFFGFVLRLHRGLLLGDAGKTITGSSALIFFFMIVSGIVLWWPKRKFNKQKFSLKKNASPKRLNYDLHSVLGFYVSWILIFTVVTGLVFSFKWFENGMYALAGSKKEKKQFHSVYSDSTSFNLQSTYELCRNEFPEHKEVFIALADDSLASVRFTVRDNSTGFFKNQHHLYFDQYSGKSIKKILFSETSKAEKLRTINYDIHTGKVFGLLGQLLVFFAAFIAASLPITGLMIWLSKRKKKEIFFTE